MALTCGAYSQNIVFTDDFEATNQWTIFEEIVGGNPAYTNGIGEVVTSAVASAGTHGLRIWANKAQTNFSNHIIGGYKLYDAGQTGVWTYSMSFMIDSNTALTGQTGPEFALASTREVSTNGYRTMEAGLQYQSTPYVNPSGAWAIWNQTIPGSAEWQVFTNQPLKSNTWYYATLQVDFTSNRYVSCHIQGDGVDEMWDLSEYIVAEQIKYTNDAFWLSLEGENLWSGGSNVFENKVYYDEVVVSRPLEVTNDITGNVTWTLFDSPVNILKSGFTVQSNGAVTIEPGVTVKSDGNMTIEGALNAVGTEENRIIFDELTDGADWGHFTFDLAGAGIYRTNMLVNVDINNLKSYIRVSRQSLFVTGCVINISGNIAYGIYGYVNKSTGNPAKIHLTSNTISVNTTKDNAGGDFRGILLDGYDAELRDNVLTVTSTGRFDTVSGIKAYKSNTTTSRCDITGNRITVDAGSAARVFQTYGVWFDSDVSGLISNNIISAMGPQDVNGILKYDQLPIVDNVFDAGSYASNWYGDIQGISCSSVGAGTNDLVVNNYVNVFSMHNSRNVSGIKCQDGLVRGNRIVANNYATNGTLSGLHQLYYSGYLEGNTISLSATNTIRAKGINVSTHYTTTATVRVYNNIITGSGASGSIGIYKSPDCAAPVLNGYNLVYNFESNHVGCAAGPGFVSANPIFVDTNLHISYRSPAVDAGTNLDWVITATDMDGEFRLDSLAVDIGADEYIFPGEISDIIFGASTVTVEWVVASGGIYKLQSSTNLVDLGWVDHGNSFTAQTIYVQTEHTNLQHETIFFKMKRFAAP